MMNNPLVVTLMMDERSFEFFDNLRRQHFPKHRNFLPAHLTLFHHLKNVESTFSMIDELASKYTRFRMAVSHVISLGNGVAFAMESELLHELHSELRSKFYDNLTAQDRQKFRPHVTIQNKVAARDAQALMQELKEIKPFEVTAYGIIVWEYLGGPWSKKSEFYFPESQPCHAR